MIRRRPELTWKYLGQIERAARGARLNRAHQVIAEMESRFERVWTLTQNIDGLHRQAGEERPGYLRQPARSALYRVRVAANGGRLRRAESAAPMPAVPGNPSACGRPVWGNPAQETVESLYDQLDAGFDVVFSIGTTSVFPYIAGPVEAASRRGWATVEINPLRHGSPGWLTSSSRCARRGDGRHLDAVSDANQVGKRLLRRLLVADGWTRRGRWFR